MKPNKTNGPPCERCGATLDENFRCNSEQCEGRYRHPMVMVDGEWKRCLCNQGHETLVLGIVR